MPDNDSYYTFAGASGNLQWSSTLPTTNNTIISQDSYQSLIDQVAIEQKTNQIHPELYFKYVKKKFGVLESMKMNRRMKALEKAFNKAAENGQDVLASKMLKEVVREAKESAMYAKGFKMFIEKEDLDRYKNKIRGGHISDTKLKDFTRVIPEKVLKLKKKTEGLFDDYIIYHYWDKEAEKKVEKKEKLTSEEKSKMRDPVLFGQINESNRLYFIGDWEDEFCDLTFEEIVDVIGKDEEDITLPREPQLIKE